MAQIRDEQYIESDWVCPNCGKYYQMKRIGLTIHSFFNCYYFCNRGCARYFDRAGNDITEMIEGRWRKEE